MGNELSRERSAARALLVERAWRELEMQLRACKNSQRRTLVKLIVKDLQDLLEVIDATTKDRWPRS